MVVGSTQAEGTMEGARVSAVHSLAAVNAQGILSDSDPAARNHKSCPPVFPCCVPPDSHNFGTTLKSLTLS